MTVRVSSKSEMSQPPRNATLSKPQTPKAGDLLFVSMEGWVELQPDLFFFVSMTNVVSV